MSKSQIPIYTYFKTLEINLRKCEFFDKKNLKKNLKVNSAKTMCCACTSLRMYNIRTLNKINKKLSNYQNIGNYGI